jgi:hypothetical protein
MHNTFAKPSKRWIAVTKSVAMLVFLMILLIAYNPVFAGGKPVGKHRLFIIPAAAYFFNSTYWDPNGVHKSYANNLRFGSTILSINSEYGFSRRLSLIGSIPFINNRISQPGYAESIAGIGDAELGARYYIANINYNVYFSVQGSVVVPLYTTNDNKSLGYGTLGVDLKLIGAGDFAISGQKFYWEANAGIRQFSGSSGPFQLKNSLSLSYSINKKNQVSLAGTSLYSYSQSKTPLDITNPLDVADTKDFDFNQLTASYAYSIKRNKSVFFSFSKFITGRNTGAGTTISVGYVYKY